jgi:murein L,D-transpeptidase YcbB/YkuD
LIKRAKNEKFKNIEMAYPVLADIELYSADGLINYANFMTYGAINPKDILSRYYVKVDRPDIISAQASLEQLNLVKFLNGLSSKDEPYEKLHDLLVADKKTPTLSSFDKAKISYSLERLRWRTKAYPAKYLLVNIPEFKLRLINNEKEEFEMKVCVGQAEDAETNHQTPILSGIINMMQVNPVWNIPKSIVVKEIASSLKNNPNYLEEKNMVAYKNGILVDENSVDWNTADATQYEFKQNPGADNSLGQIKFVFKNSYAIYLHDTPAQAAFNQSNRAVSHGCVRVQDPMKLASAFVSSNEAEQIKKETEEAAAGGQVITRWVKATTPIPVFIEYYTAWVDKDGKLIIANDVYSYDSKLFDAFKNFMAK